MFKHSDDSPVYTIGVVAEMLDVHPETLRIWERNDLVEPTRRNRHRLYSNNDIKRLRYIHYLTADKGLNIAGVKQLIQLYPCWKLKNCAGGRKSNTEQPMTKPCWKEEETYCLAVEDKADLCKECEEFQKNCKVCRD